jgi:hypothetical protein
MSAAVDVEVTVARMNLGLGFGEPIITNSSLVASISTRTSTIE